MTSDIIRKVDILTSAGNKFLELYLVMRPDEELSTGAKRLAGLRLPTQLDDTKKTDLSIVCAPQSSEVIFWQKNAAYPYWIARTTDGTEVHIKAEFTLDLNIACPLMWRIPVVEHISNQLEPIHIKLIFDKMSPSNIDIKLEWQTPYSIGGVIQLPKGSGTVQDLLKKFRFDTSLLSTLFPPYLLVPDAQFCSRPPLGAHYRTITFRSPQGEDKGSHFLFVRYHADDWGHDIDKLPKIVPFDLAMKGKNGDFSNWSDDILLQQSFELADVDGHLVKLEASWTLDLIWQLVDPTTFPSSLVSPLKIWNQFIAEPYFDSLRSVKNGSPISVLPIFDANANPTSPELLRNQRWVFRYLVTDRDAFTLTTDPDRFDYAFKSMNPFPNSYFFAPAKLHGFRDHKGGGIQRILEVGNSNLNDDMSTTESLPGPKDASIFLNWRDLATGSDFSALNTGDIQPSRAGALDLLFKLPTHQDIIQPHQSSDGFVNVIIGFGGALYTVRALRAKMIMRLAGAAPGGQDATPDDYRIPAQERPVSVVTPYLEIGQSAVVPIAGPMDLIVKESCEYERTQSVSMSLQQVTGKRTGGKTTLDTLVLNFDPLIVARVKSDPVFSSTIGNFSGVIESDASWQLQDEVDGLELILPPQVVGEEFIHDYPSVAPQAFPFCFSPNAKFSLSRSVLEQNYTEAPWNLRKLLGWSNQRSPGSPIYGLQFELLYGLQTQIDESGLRLAEFESTVGSLPILPVSPRGQLPSSTDKTKSSFIKETNRKIQRNDNEVKADLKSLKSRLAVMRVVRGDERALDLTSGIRYRLRPSRRSRANFEPPTTRGALAGGVDFGIEAPAAHEKLLATPESTEGRIVNPSFSAIGGSGFQKASFLKGNLSIYSNTSFGRTFFYSVEMLGRISVFWNRAKHVVIYERRVVDTDRFVDQNHVLDGRAAIRKVDEYVEILEAEKDFGSTQLSGFIEGTKFPQPIIKVDSRWATSLEDASGKSKGWVVPLHSKEAPRDLYPRPDVLLKLSGSETGQITWATITNPEQLYFFTTGDDKPVESWLAFPGVDFPLLTNTLLVTSPTAQSTVSPIRDGLANFTFKIDTKGGRTNLLKARADRAVEALIENVTVSRVSLSGKEHPPADRTLHSDLVAMQSEVSAAVNSLENCATEAITGIDLASNAKFINALSKARTETQNGFNKISAKFSAVATGLKSTVAQLQAKQSNLKVNWDKSRSMILASQSLLGEKLDVSASLPTLQETWDRTEANAKDRLQALVTFGDQLRALYVVNVASPIEFIALAIDSIIAEFERAERDLRKLVLKLQGEAGQYNSSPEIFNSFVLRSINEIMDLLIRLRSACGQTFPGLLSERIELVAASGGAAAVVLDTKVVQSVDVFAQNVLASQQDIAIFNAELQRVAQDMTLAKGEIENKLKRANGLYDTYSNARTNLSSAFTTNFNLVALAAKPTWTEAKDSLETSVQQLDNAVKAFELALNLANFQQEIDSILGEVGQAVGGALDPLTRIVKAEAEKIAGILDTVANGIKNGNALVLNETKELERLTNHCLGRVDSIIGSFATPIESKVRELESRSNAIPDEGMRLVRAFGDPPVAKALSVDLKKLEYVFQDSELPVLFTETKISFNKAEHAISKAADLIEPTNLKALGIDLPSSSLLDDFLPLKLPKFDLKSILPDFAGLKLSDLLGDVIDLNPKQMEGVKITHGLDPTTKLPWAKSNVDIKVNEEFKVFDFDPVALTIPRSHFQAECSVSIDKQGVPRTNMHGTIAGTWQLQIAQKNLLTFKDTALTLNNAGNLSFDLRPQNVVIEPPLNFVSDLVNKLNYRDEKGLSVEILRASGSELPIGARALLNVALPDYSFGAFSISHLSINAFFQVSFEPKTSTSDSKFSIGAGFGLASREKPFTMTIMCLGGGGWFTVRSNYDLLGKTRGLTTDLSIGLALAANLAFDIGIARGGVYFYFKAGVEWHSNGGGGLQISLEIEIVGEVQILSIVSASISISLIGTYDGGTGSIYCEGRLRVRIKICWCFTISVNKSVMITLKGKKPSPPSAGIAPAGSAPPPVAGIAGAGFAVHALPVDPDMSLITQMTTQKIADSVETYMNCFGD